MTISAIPEAVATANGGVMVVSAECDASGRFWVNMPCAGRVRARSLVGTALPKILDRQFEVVVITKDGDPRHPIVIGVVLEPDAPVVDVTIDGKTVILNAEQEITLRCGRAAITLTKTGRILISGEYVVSRARGTHRIKGGSVQIN